MKVTKVTMKNIFVNAKFGDKFRTRDGKMAILLQTHNCAVLAINFDSYAVTHDYKMDGTSVFNCHDLDIVSKWQEPINEKELDRLAEEYVGNSKPLVDGDCKSCFKAGFRKAMGENYELRRTTKLR